MRPAAFGLVLMSLSCAAAIAQPAVDWTTVRGQVTLPANVAIPVPKPVGGAKGVVDETVVVNPKSRGIKNVVVWLRPNVANLKAGFAPNEVHPGDANRKAGDVIAELEGDRVKPRIVAARTGDTVVVKNTSTVAHRFFWVSTNNGDLDIEVAPGGRLRFAQPLASNSVPAQFICTDRPWVRGFARVFDHPYYAVTDEDGRFEFKSAPMGNYRLVFWHENVGYLGGKDGRRGQLVRIAPGQMGTMQLDPTQFDVTR
ncbi:MAG: hypothetical protein U0792_17600 [Gemmataceae bacterium]